MKSDNRAVQNPLNETLWGDFKVSELFDVRYGINMELNSCCETTNDDPEAIAFVARTAENNGVSAFVKPAAGKIPQPAGTITVAGGGSVLSTFLQVRPFYSGRDLYLLLPKNEMSTHVKLFITTVLQCEKYRFNYGRQANKSLRDLKLHLPITADGKPNWEWMENYIKSLHYKPITTRNKHPKSFDVSTWKEFRLGSLIDEIYKAKAHAKSELTTRNSPQPGYVPFVSRTEACNGVDCYVSLEDHPQIEEGNALIVGDTTATTSYQPYPFTTGDHIVIIRSSWLNEFTGMFMVALLKREKYKYSYGRAYKTDLINNTVVKLPATSSGEPDWEWMEDYVRSLPYADRLVQSEAENGTA